MLFFRHREEKELNLYAENIRCLEIKKGLVKKGRIQSNVRFGLVSDLKVCNKHGRYSVEVHFNLCFKIKPYLGFDL